MTKILERNKLLADPRLRGYIFEHSTPADAALTALMDETVDKTDRPGMMSAIPEIRLLQAMITSADAKTIVEVGTFTGVGALSMASVLPDDGHLYTLEIDPDRAAIAQAAFSRSPHGDKIEILLGDALASLDKLDGPFDLVYIDADKTQYGAYYEAILPKLAERGLIVVDNVLWSGTVLDPPADDEQTLALAAFNDQVQADPRVVNTLLSCGDGLLVIRRA